MSQTTGELKIFRDDSYGETERSTLMAGRNSHRTELTDLSIPNEIWRGVSCRDPIRISRVGEETSHPNPKNAEVMGQLNHGLRDVL